MTQNILSQLETAINNSKYTVALCGSGCLKECGLYELKSQEHAYAIESKYGISPEYLYTSAYYSSRPKQFFDFYKNELLTPENPPSPTSLALAAMEKKGKLNFTITSNIFNFPQRAGCKNVINLHGHIYNNYCTTCGHNHSVEYIKNSDSIPLCEKCGRAIRPGVSFFGDMMDNALITKAIEEIEKSELLLLLGTTLRSEVFHHFLNHFNGHTLAIIHEDEDVSDKNADIVIYSQPKKVFHELGYI